MMTDMKGRLVVVPTPLGNLSDISQRVKEILSETDIIACEDTRTTGRLLKHLDSRVPTLSYHMHNEAGKSDDILEMIRDGKTVALVSDAGMPGISDPGHVLIGKVIEAGLEVSVIPGPSAFVTALVGSGLPTDRFTFIGFLDKNRTQRRRELENLKDRQETLIFYEAPHRLIEFLETLEDILGDRKCVLARELTKVYEEYERDSISGLLTVYGTKVPKGEYVVLVSGKTKEDLEKEKAELLAGISIRDQVQRYMDEGMSKMDAVKKCARERGLKKNDVYTEVLDLT